MTTLAWVFLITTIFTAWTGFGFFWIMATADSYDSSWYDGIIVFPAKCIIAVILMLSSK